jgi:hypothetical protein
MSFKGTDGMVSMRTGARSMKKASPTENFGLIYALSIGAALVEAKRHRSAIRFLCALCVLCGEFSWMLLAPMRGQHMFGNRQRQTFHRVFQRFNVRLEPSLAQCIAGDRANRRKPDFAKSVPMVFFQ